MGAKTAGGVGDSQNRSGARVVKPVSDARARVTVKSPGLFLSFVTAPTARGVHHPHGRTKSRSVRFLCTFVDVIIPLLLLLLLLHRHRRRTKCRSLGFPSSLSRFFLVLLLLLHYLHRKTKCRSDGFLYAFIVVMILSSSSSSSIYAEKNKM